MEQRITNLLIRYRHLWAVLSVLLCVGLTLGAKNLFFDSDYKVFLKPDNPQLLAYDEIQNEYTKTETLSLFITSDKGLMRPEALSLIESLTEELWLTPYAQRVDSLTNFQYTIAQGDELFVDDFIRDAHELSSRAIDQRTKAALAEKQLLNRFISADTKSTLLAVQLELPVVDFSSSRTEQQEQRSLREQSFHDIAAFTDELKGRLRAEYPDMEAHLNGVTEINRSLNESSREDFSLLVPIMYVVILVAIFVFLRSFGAALVSFMLTSLVSVATLGFAGWLGFALSPVNSLSLIIVLTITVCDAVHLLVIYLRQLSRGQSRVQAMHESMRINLMPIALTSVTTAVGFLTLNFSPSPVFASLGTISAAGIMLAMLLSMSLMPTLCTLLVRKARFVETQDSSLKGFADFVLKRRAFLVVSVVLLIAALGSQVTRNFIDDDPGYYFKEGVPIRDAMEHSKDHLRGVKDMLFSLDCGVENCIHDPAYLEAVAEFGAWFEQQPDVEFVASYVDIIKRLNQNMNADDPEYYRVPDNKQLAAQYHLLYELSLPYGLDMKNQVNFDKSATKFSVFTGIIPTGEFLELANESRQWLAENQPQLTTEGAGIFVMFAVLGENNVRSLAWGALFALAGVTLTILVALRSFKYAALSLLPNVIPAFLALSVWGIIDGRVNMGVAAVFSITLGIIVDDTVHFISKYRRARMELGYSGIDAVHYAFDTVGAALITTTIVLTIGFSLLTLSDLNLNANMGLLTAITIVIALVFDFLILPIMLLFFDKEPNLKA